MVIGLPPGPGGSSDQSGYLDHPNPGNNSNPSHPDHPDFILSLLCFSFLFFSPLFEIHASDKKLFFYLFYSYLSFFRPLFPSFLSHFFSFLIFFPSFSFFFYLSLFSLLFPFSRGIVSRLPLPFQLVALAALRIFSAPDTTFLLPNTNHPTSRHSATTTTTTATNRPTGIQPPLTTPPPTCCYQLSPQNLLPVTIFNRSMGESRNCGSIKIIAKS